MASLGSGGPPEVIPSVSSLSIDWEEISDGELIGQGGNADVYRGTIIRDGESIPVAIKQPRLQGTLHTDALNHFHEETKVWYQLDKHNHIVTLFDGGTEPLPWLAMEYMDGGSLLDMLSEGRLPFKQALWVGYCVCQAVHHAHRHGVAHHDLKPANILFRKYDSCWMVPKVSDWGLARMMLEETGSVDGLSPHYSAPEQFDADQYGSPNDQTDIYQAGTLLYELLTGKPPFEGTMTEVMQGVLSRDPVPPSDIANLPTVVDDLILPAIKKEQQNRYDSIVYLRDGIKELFELAEQADINLNTASKNEITQSSITEGDIKNLQNEQSSEQTQNNTSNIQSNSETTSKLNTRSSLLDRQTSKSDRSSSLLDRRSMLALFGVTAVGLGSWQVTSDAPPSSFLFTDTNDDTITTETETDASGSSSSTEAETGDQGNDTDESTEEAIVQTEAFLEDNDALSHKSLEDRTGESVVVIETGGGDNGFSFVPPGIIVDSGTTVVWEWTGRGGGHNVVNEPDSDFEFESRRTDEEGFTFEQTFEEEGAALYVCTPHRAQGKYGGVAVI